MKKTTALVFGFFILTSGFVFANDTGEGNFLLENSVIIDNNKNIENADNKINNTITLDLSPALYSLLFSGIFKDSKPSTGFGIGAQYERQITDDMSAALRLEYGMYDMSDNARKWMMSSLQAEGHFRYYFAKSIFFSDFTLGYAYIFFDNSKPDKKIITNAHYLKYGAKIGWRIDFNKPCGFVFEPGLGIYGALGTKFKETESFDDFPVLGDFLNSLFNGVNNAFAEILFLSGVRLSLSFGYRF